MQLFLPNEEGELLAEYASGGRPSSDPWPPGQGATGIAWSTNGFVRAVGHAVSDATYGLTEEQQERYRDLRVVVANPVQNARGRAIGVLVLSSREDDAYFEDPDAQLQLVALCEV